MILDRQLNHTFIGGSLVDEVDKVWTGGFSGLDAEQLSASWFLWITEHKFIK